MKQKLLRSQAWSTCIFLSFFTVLFGLIYPGIITLINQSLFPQHAQGNLIYLNNQLRGSYLLGQSFLRNDLFSSRASATAVFPYNSLASSGSNLSPGNPKLLQLAHERVAYLKNINPGQQKIPLDLLYASGSGLDPHITLAAAHYQVARIAKARGLNAHQINTLIDAYMEKPQFGILGETRINVVKLNIALEEMSKKNDQR